MKLNKLFMDSSALMAGILSSEGGARALLLLSENHKIDLVVSEQVITEVERNIARKAPKLLPFARELILQAQINILLDPKTETLKDRQDWISHIPDLPILAAAADAQVDFLVTLNTRHFVDDPQAAKKSSLHIGTPGDALAWLRKNLPKD